MRCTNIGLFQRTNHIIQKTNHPKDGSVMKVSGTEEALGLRLRLQGVGTVPWRFTSGKTAGHFSWRYFKGLPKPWITAGRYSIHLYEGNPIF